VHLGGGEGIDSRLDWPQAPEGARSELQVSRSEPQASEGHQVSRAKIEKVEKIG
jgi:hypothetical protein